MFKGFKIWYASALALLFLLVACTATTPNGAVPRLASNRMTIVAIGDMPYRPRDIPPFETLLGEIDAIGPDVTIHVGDIKGGGSPCTDALFAQQRDYMDSVAGPLVYTPGDNEWTDCRRRSAGGL